MELKKVKIIATPDQLDEICVDIGLLGLEMIAWDWGFNSKEYGISANVGTSFDLVDFWTIPTKYLEVIEEEKSEQAIAKEWVNKTNRRVDSWNESNAEIADYGRALHEFMDILVSNEGDIDSKVRLLREKIEEYTGDFITGTINRSDLTGLVLMPPIYQMQICFYWLTKQETFQ